MDSARFHVVYCGELLRRSFCTSHGMWVLTLVAQVGLARVARGCISGAFLTQLPRPAWHIASMICMLCEVGFADLLTPKREVGYTPGKSHAKNTGIAGWPTQDVS